MIAAISTTEQKNGAPTRKRWGPIFLFGSAEPVEIASADGAAGRGVELGFQAACGLPAERRPLASGRLSDSSDSKIAFGDFALASSIQRKFPRSNHIARKRELLRKRWDVLLVATSELSPARPLPPALPQLKNRLTWPPHEIHVSSA